MASNIIDNRVPPPLNTRIKNYLSESWEADFAVGYFFLSGIIQLKEPLKKSIIGTSKGKWRLVIGNATDRGGGSSLLCR